MFYIMQTSSAEGQTFFDFALGGDTFSPSNAVVRSVSDQKVIASYWDGTYYRQARVGLTDFIFAKMDDHHEIADIRIVGDDIFFCGMDRSTNHAFLGHATVPDIESQNPHIEFYDIIIPYTTISRFWRLAAYLDSPNVTRLVAVGDFWYTNDGVNPQPSGVPSCSLSGTCQSTFAVEYTYMSGGFNYVGNKVFSDNSSHYEYACDVVETDHYVAVLTFPAADELIIHRCDKTNVLASLGYPNIYYYYKVPPRGAAFYGCKMKGDTIAVASVFNNGPGTDELQLRVVDLTTMNMPHAQTFDLLDKDDIYEMTYLPDIQRLVLLQNQTYTPLTLLRHTFCFMKPYETVFPYNMEKIYEANSRKFTSLDRLSSKHIVAAGGDYWMMKDVSVNNPASTCYVIKNQLVKKLATSTPLTRNHTFQSTIILPTIPTPCNETYDWDSMMAPCITPY